MSDGTYGGITRSSAASLNNYAESGGGQLTIEMLNDAFRAIWRMDEESRRCEQLCAERMQRFNHLASMDHVAYIAAYRLVKASVYMECALHPTNAAEYIAILKDRGIEF